MAKTAKHDVFDMSDDIARIKRTKSIEISDVGDSGNDLSYTTGKGSQRRVAKDTDKMLNVRVSKELHKRFRMESIDRGESMNLLIVRAMVDYADRKPTRPFSFEDCCFCLPKYRFLSCYRIGSVGASGRPRPTASCITAATGFAIPRIASFAFLAAAVMWSLSLSVV